MKTYYLFQRVILLCIVTTLFTFSSFTAFAQYTSSKIISNYGSNAIPRTVKVADLNKDGALDVLSLGHFSNDPIRYAINSGTGESFTTYSLPGSDKFPEYGYITTADIDKNGFEDIIAITNADFGWSTADNKVIVWYNNGNLGFSSPVTLIDKLSTSNGAVIEMHTLDMDNDGDLDILLPGQYLGGDFRIGWLKNNGKNSTWELKIINNSGGAVMSVVADLNNDNSLEIIAHPGSAGKLVIYAGPDFTPKQLDLGFYLGREIGLHAVDIDRDGDLDLVGGTKGYGEGIFIAENLGSLNFKVHYISNSAGDYTGLVVDDLDQDGLPDIVVDCGYGCNLTYFKNQGNFTFSKESTAINNYISNRNSIAVADLDKDGRKDLVVADGSLHLVKWYKSSFLQFVGVEAKFMAPTTTCYNNAVKFQDVSRGKDISSWLWNFGDGNTSTEKSPLHTFTKSGNYNVTLTVTNKAGEKNTKSHIIKVDYNLDLASSYRFDVCRYEETVLSLAKTSDNSIYTWYYSATDATPFHTGINLTKSFSRDEETYYVERASEGGCKSKRVPVTIKTYLKPDVPSIADVASYSGPATLKFTREVGGGTLYWYKNATDESPFYVGHFYEKYFTQTESFYVEAVNEMSGCRSTDRVKVTAHILEQPLSIPQFVWADALNPSKGAFNQGESIQLDSDGNTVVWGVFGPNSIKAGDVIIETSGNNQNQLYMLKYDSTGKAISGSRIIDGMTESFNNLEFLLDSEDNVIFTAITYYSGSVNLAGTKINFGSNRIVAKFNASGELLWYKLFPQTNPIQLTETGDIVIGIKFYEQITLGGHFFGSTDRTGKWHNIVAKYSADGELKEIKELANLEYLHGYNNSARSYGESQVAMDGYGNFYQYAEIENATVVDGTTITLPYSNITGAVLLKYSPEGRLLWYKTITNPKHLSALHSEEIKIHRDVIYITGISAGGITNFSGTELSDAKAFIASYTLDGEERWVNSLQSPHGTANINSINIDDEDAVFITGLFDGSYPVISGFRIGDSIGKSGSTLYQSGFAAKIHKNGSLLWARGIGNTLFKDAAVNRKGELLIHGTFEGSLLLDDIQLSAEPTGYGYSIFTARLGSSFKVIMETNGNCLDKPVKFFDVSQWGPEESFVKREWNFGDGTRSSEKNPAHTYKIGKEYDVTLTVYGSQGTVKTVSKKVNVQAPLYMEPIDIETFTIAGCSPGLINARVAGEPYMYHDLGYDWYVNGKLVQSNYRSTLTYALQEGDELLVRAKSTVLNNSCQSLQVVEKTKNYSASATRPFKPSLYMFWGNGDYRLQASQGDSYKWYLNGVLLPEFDRYMITPSEYGRYKVEVTINGCSIMSDEFKYTVAGVIDDAVAGISVYPNPTSDELYILSDNLVITNIWIHDNKGQLLREVVIDKNVKEKVLDLKHLSSGLYFIKLAVAGGKVSMHKVIKL